METRLRGFASSWSFAPAPGSADLDLFKRIKDTPFEYKVVQVRSVQQDDGVLRFATRATLERVEVATDPAHPHTRRTRDDFIAAALREFKREPHRYDFLLSHSGPSPSHAAAWQLKREHPGLPWVASFGDFTTGNPSCEDGGGSPLTAEDLETEARTLQHADLLLLHSEHQQQRMLSGERQRYAHKTLVIPPCYEPAMYPREPSAPNARFTFVHRGALDHGGRTAEPLLRAVDRLIEVYPRYKGQFEVVLDGSAVTAHDLGVHALMRNRSQVRFEEPLPYLESLCRLRAADALVLIDDRFDLKADGLEASPFFPGELTDGMGADRPMFAITMDRGPTAEVLRASGNLVADGRVDRIAYVLKRYLDRKVTPDTSSFRRFECRQVAAQMEEAIRRTVKAARAASGVPLTSVAA